MTSSIAHPTVPTRADRRAWLGLAVLFLPTLLIAIDNTVLGFALPAITTALGPSAAQVLWLVDIYPLVLAGLLVTMGTVADRIGRRRTLLVGVVGFGIVSLVAAFAVDAVQLIAARALLGFFGAMLMPAALALLRTLFVDRVQRRLAVAIWATGFSAGAALGPIVGGVLLEHFWWGSVFLINVPVMVLALVLGLVVLPESRPARAGTLDLRGALLALLAMGPTVLAVKLIGSDGITATSVLALAVGVASGVLFVRRARERIAAGEEPLLDLRLFASPVLRLAALANAATMFAFTGMLFMFAQYLLLVLELAPLDAALVLVPGSIVTILAGLFAARLARSFPVRVLVPAGLILTAAGYLLSSALGGITVLLAATLLVGAGIGLSETITNDAILGAAPADRAGSASAVSETAYELGSVLGTALLGSVLTAVYRGAMVMPSSVDPIDADAATETLGGAVAVADRMTGAQAADLLSSAQAAFIAAVDVTALVGSGVLVAVAVLVVVGLRDRSTGSAGRF